jgi:hypothetical protein
MSTRPNSVRDVIGALAAAELVREQRRRRSKITFASNSLEAVGDYARGEMQQRIRRTREARARLRRAPRSL